MHQSSLRNSRMALALALLSGLWMTASGRAAEIHVPSQQPTIQAGINAAVNGDEVVLAEGTYTGVGNVNCNFNGKLITVRSARGNAEACIVDCQDTPTTRGFSIVSGETSAAELQDITITRATLPAITCSGTSSPVIRGCWLVANNAGGSVGLLCNGTGSPLVEGCLFYDNHGNTGGAASVGGSAVVQSCRFVSNSASSFNSAGGGLNLNGPVKVVNCLFQHNSAGRGGGVHVSGPHQFEIMNCTFVSNLGHGNGTGGAVFVSSGSTAVLRNCIVYNNLPNQFVLLDASSTIDVAHSNVEDGSGGLGNIDDGPFFTDALGADDIAGTLDDDYSIRSFSPCADSGDNGAVPAGVLLDLAGNPRFVDDPNSPDTGLGTPPLVDMGCYEVQSAVVLPDTCPADVAPVDGDGVVDVDDLLAIINAWGFCK